MSRARTGELIVEVADDGVGGADPGGGSGLRGLADRVEALGGQAARLEPAGAGHTRAGGDPVRVVVADDAMLLREGIARLLTEAGFDVVGQSATAEDLLADVRAHAPDVAIVDIRMPPTHTDEGLRAALAIRADAP